MFPGLISLCCVMNEVTQLFYQQFDGLSLESVGTRFLPTHLFHPKEFFLASTRGVYRSLQISSQFFSALHLGLGDILLSAFYSENLPASPEFSCFVARCCSSQHSLAWSLRDMKLPWDQLALSCLQSSLETWSSLLLAKQREDLQRGQYEYKISTCELYAVISSPFFSLFSPPNNWTQAFLLEVSLLLCYPFIRMRSQFSLAGGNPRAVRVK